MWVSWRLLGMILVLAAQGSVTAQLPAAPSAVRQEQEKPKPAAQTPPTSQQSTAQPSSQQPDRPPSAPSEPPKSGSEAALPTPQVTEPDESVATFRARVDEVSMLFTVAVKRGRFVKDLVKDDFKILDDDKPPQAVVSFRGEANLPLRLGLLIDASNSVRDRFRFEQEAAVQFLNQNIRYGYDQAFVLGFDTVYEVTQEFTDDTEKLTNGVRVLKPGGGTALYDAFYYACRDKLLKNQMSGPARRAIVLLSDSLGSGAWGVRSPVVAAMDA
jgi:hypothetical protein